MYKINHDYPTPKCTVHSENCKYSQSTHNKQPKDGYWGNISNLPSEGSKCQCGKGIIRYAPCMTGKKCR